MKVHIDKKKETIKTGLFGKKIDRWTVKIYFELNDLEQQVIDSNPDIKDIVLFEYRYDDYDDSPKVHQFIDKKCVNIEERWILFADTSSQVIDLENKINQSAEELKAHIDSMKNTEGSTVREL